MELSPEHLKLFKKFKNCINKKSIAGMDKSLYQLCHLQCGFIAHYSIYCFRDTYSGQQYLEWFDHFAKPNWNFHHYNEYDSLRRCCEQYAKQKQEEVYAHFERLERNEKIRLFNKLSKELGYDTSTKKEGVSGFKEEESGQLSLFG